MVELTVNHTSNSTGSAYDVTLTDNEQGFSLDIASKLSFSTSFVMLEVKLLVFYVILANGMYLWNLVGYCRPLPTSSPLFLDVGDKAYVALRCLSYSTFIYLTFLYFYIQRR